VAESWFATLKTEIGTTIWATREQARADVFAFIQRYNRNRSSPTLNYLTPRKPNCATVKSYRSRHENPVSVEAGGLQMHCMRLLSASKSRSVHVRPGACLDRQELIWSSTMAWENPAVPMRFWRRSDQCS
jgi:hypothetical protein